MPEFSKHCDPVDALDFRPDESRPIGYLLELAVAGTTVPSDLKVAVPTDVTAQSPPHAAGIRLTPAVAVLGSVYWSTRPSDPIRIFAYAEMEVARTLAALRTRDAGDQAVQLSLVVYDYDHQRGVYFTEFQASAVSGRLGRDGLLVAEDWEDLTPGVRVHALQFEVLPAPGSQPQRILLQPSPGATLVREFGLSHG